MADDSRNAPDGATQARPATEATYGIPSDLERMLPWAFVEETMTAERFFWVTTVRPDGRPHARPTWGVWLDGTFYCGGGERTRWVRNLAVDPWITVHTESAESVVIIEGSAVRHDEQTADPVTLERVDDAYEEKYAIRHGTPLFAVRPDTVLAWTNFPIDATRWQFET